MTDGARHQARHDATRRLASVRRELTFEWPAQGTVTTVFGHTEGRWHPGIDIGTLRGLTVRAAVPGVVKAVGYATGFEGYGNIVLVQDARSMQTLYAHLSSFHVHVGQRVREGQPLGIAGCTGYCSGTHLHFEVRVRGRAVDPMRWL